MRRSANTLIAVPFVLMSVFACARHEATAPQSDAASKRGIPASVSVRPPQDLLTVGASGAMSAYVEDSLGNPVQPSVTWTTSDSTIVRVSNAGPGAQVPAAGTVTVSGVKLGTATITATVGGIAASATVTVYTSTTVPAAVYISPDSAAIDFTLNNSGAYAHTTAALTATVTDSSGNAIAGEPVVWSTSDATVATVDATGLVTANTSTPPGTAMISAAIGTLKTSVPIFVNPPADSISLTPKVDTLSVGGQVQLTVTVYDAQGRPELHGRPASWSSGSGITISSTGLMTATAVGTWTYQAIVGNSTTGLLAIGGKVTVH